MTKQDMARTAYEYFHGENIKAIDDLFLVPQVSRTKNNRKK